MLNLPIIVAFVAGIVSFLSPCVLPIIPGFLAYLAGESTAGTQPSRLSIFLNSLFFVIGFAVVFAILGVLLNTVLAHAAYATQEWLSWIGGALVIFFGLYLMGFFKIPFLEFDHKMKVGVSFRSRYLTSLVFGFAFAAGWTPCVGPISAASSDSRHQRRAKRSTFCFPTRSDSASPSSSSVCSPHKRRIGSIVMRQSWNRHQGVRRHPRRPWHPCLHAEPIVRRELRFCKSVFA